MQNSYQIFVNEITNLNIYIESLHPSLSTMLLIFSFCFIILLGYGIGLRNVASLSLVSLGLYFFSVQLISHVYPIIDILDWLIYYLVFICLPIITGFLIAKPKQTYKLTDQKNLWEIGFIVMALNLIWLGELLGIIFNLKELNYIFFISANLIFGITFVNVVIESEKKKGLTFGKWFFIVSFYFTMIIYFSILYYNVIGNTMSLYSL